MTQYAVPGAVAPDADLSDRAIVAGVGTSDFPSDYRATRRGDGLGADQPQSALMKVAFERACVDSGLDLKDIDGLVVCGSDGMTDRELAAIAADLGVTPRYLARDTYLMAGVAPRAVEAIARRACRTVALVYVGTRRRAGASFGGPSSQTGPTSYSYHHPWGWSSQPAHWALIFQRYMALFGVTEADLGSVAVTLRRNAMANDNAIMRDPLDLDGYLAARYVVRPMRLLDLCLVSDGSVCVVLTDARSAPRLAHPAVHIAGWGDAEVNEPKLDYLVRQRLQPLFEVSAGQAFSMAGLTVRDVDLFGGYDSSSIHLINQIEGYGFSRPGTALRDWADGQMERDGRLPVNTSGGMMSEAFMHGWSQVVEVVRQLRHQTGVRQVAEARIGMTSVATTQSAHPLLFRRGEE